MNRHDYIELEKMHFVNCAAKDCQELVDDDNDSHYFKFCKQHRQQFDSKSFSEIVGKKQGNRRQ